MAVLSKVLRDRDCKGLVHRWTNSCTLAALDMGLQCYRGALNFFYLLYLIPLILKYRELDGMKLISAVKYLMRSALFVGVFGAGIYYMHCICRRVLGEYYDATAVTVPTMIAGLAIFLEDPSKWTIDLFVFVNTMLEWWFNLAQRRTHVQLSSAQKTAMFTIFSSTLLYMLRRPDFRKHVSTSGLWFYFPPRVRRSEDLATKPGVPACSHDGSCISSVLKEAGKLMGFGVAAQLLRICAQYINAGPNILLRKLFNKNTFALGAFLGAYVSIYKGISCILCRLRGRDSELHAIPAGILAGTAFRLHLDNTIGFSALTTIIQIIVSRLLASMGLSNLPQLKGIAFSLCAAFMVNASLTDPTSTPRIFNKTIDRCSNGRTAALREMFGDLIKLHHLEKFPITLAGI